MTVKQLIKKLQALPPGMRVGTYNGEYDGEVKSLVIRKCSHCPVTDTVNEDPTGQDWLFFSDA